MINYRERKFSQLLDHVKESHKINTMQSILRHMISKQLIFLCDEDAMCYSIFLDVHPLEKIFISMIRANESTSEKIFFIACLIIQKISPHFSWLIVWWSFFMWELSPFQLWASPALNTYKYPTISKLNAIFGLMYEMCNNCSRCCLKINLFLWTFFFNKNSKN
jgi:hypothetical protein